MSLGIIAPWWLCILAVMIGIGGGIWYYSRTTPPVTTFRRIILTVLRSIGLTLLVIALFEPVLSFVRSRVVEPGITVLVDNSLSMTIDENGKPRSTVMKEVWESSGLKSLSDDVDIVVFNETVTSLQPGSIDSLKFNGARTDIERAFRYVGDHAVEQNTQAVVLISDGVFTAGANPLYGAEKSARPVYVIGIGDTIEPQDVSVQSLLTNEQSYIGVSQPVSVVLKSNGIDAEAVTVSLTDNGAVVEEKTVVLSKSQQVMPLQFTYKPTQAGSRKLTATVKGMSKELTQKNNTASEFVNVKDTKRKIVLFAGAPSPDVSFIRSSLEQDKSVQLTTYIQKTGAEFYEPQPNSSTLREAEMIFCIGFPVQSTSASSLAMLQEALRLGKPLFLVVSQNLDYTKLRSLEEFLPFTVQTSRPNEFSITALVEDDAVNNPLVKITGTASDIATWNQLPPLFRTETFVRPKPEATTVATMKAGAVVLSEPLIMMNSFQRSKTVAVLGYGLYRWKLLGNAQEQSKGKSDIPDVLTSFLQNSMKWLSTDENEKQVRIVTNKRFYSSGDVVECRATVNNAAQSPIDNATVTVKISGSNDSRELVLTQQGNGTYTSIVTGLPEGDYTYSGTAVANGTTVGKDGGRFSIGNVSVEYRTLTMNKDLLTTIASRTGGRFYTPEVAKKLLDDIKSNAAIRTRTITSTDEFALWNLAYILAASLLAFATEWLIRKRSGLI
ncbi:MAG: hypothetical protein JNL32_09525 [Candidatus Kapabacteria bacterium]|nr:hypothetical protein [Candidatus Kapabacteria bacterium]